MILHRHTHTCISTNALAYYVHTCSHTDIEADRQCACAFLPSPATPNMQCSMTNQVQVLWMSHYSQARFNITCNDHLTSNTAWTLRPDLTTWVTWSSPHRPPRSTHTHTHRTIHTPPTHTHVQSPPPLFWFPLPLLLPPVLLPVQEAQKTDNKAWYCLPLSLGVAFVRPWKRGVSLVCFGSEWVSDIATGLLLSLLGAARTNAPWSPLIKSDDTSHRIPGFWFHPQAGLSQKKRKKKQKAFVRGHLCCVLYSLDGTVRTCVTQFADGLALTAWSWLQHCCTYWANRLLLIYRLDVGKNIALCALYTAKKSRAFYFLFLYFHSPPPRQSFSKCCVK